MYGGNNRKSGLGAVARGLTMRGPYTDSIMDHEMDEMDEASYEPDMQEVGDFIGRLLMSAPIIHMLHLQTDSSAKHLALGELYDSLPDDVDLVIEEFQGCYGTVPSYNTYVAYTANPVIFVEDLLNFTKKNRDCMGPSSSINSSIDIVVTSIAKTLYKLKSLK